MNSGRMTAQTPLAPDQAAEKQRQQQLSRFLDGRIQRKLHVDTHCDLL
jgi:hypothetical protein